jgi:hypothetical protein
MAFEREAGKSLINPADRVVGWLIQRASGLRTRNLERVHSRQEKERLDVVQDLKSFGLWNEAAAAKAMSDVVQKMKSSGILKGDESWLPAH